MGRRRRAGDHAVDTAVGGGRAAWALAGPDGVVATGEVALRQRPRDDSTAAEAAGIAAACAHVPRGARLATDALGIVKAVRGRRPGEAGGTAGEAAAACRAAGVELVWRRRTDALVRTAHRAARAALKRLDGG